MLYPHDINHYVESLEAIEDSFRLTWLQRWSDLSNRKASPPQHPVPFDWLAASNAVHSGQISQIYQLNEGPRRLLEIGADLKIAKKFPHFYEQMKHTELIKPEKYLDTIYPAQIAALASRSGFEVEFIPTAEKERKKRPDLLLVSGDHRIEAECKRLHVFTGIEHGRDKWAALQNTLVNLEPDHEADFDIVVCAISSLSDDAINEIPEHAKCLLSRGSGMRTNPRLNCAVAVFPAPPSMPPPTYNGLQGTQIEMPMPQLTGMTEGIARAYVSTSEDGKITRTRTRRVFLYLINSHKFDTPKSRLKSAKKQISEGAIAVTYINLDLSSIIGTAKDIYMELVGSWFHNRFNEKSKFSAIVLTADAEMIYDDDYPGLPLFGNRVRYIENPYSPVPKGITIPGNI